MSCGCCSTELVTKIHKCCERTCDGPGCTNPAAVRYSMGDLFRYSCGECKDWTVKWISKHQKAVAKAGPFDIDNQDETVKGAERRAGGA